MTSLAVCFTILPPDPDMRDDLYEQLGVSHRADRQAIKTAYRRMAMRLHPDRTGGDTASAEHFRLITEAWHTLGDPARRAEYDEWLELHRRYDHLPEMEHMPRHHARMSMRNAVRRSERRVHRSSDRRVNRRIRPFLLRRVSHVTAWHYLLMCALCLVCVLPGVFRAVRGLRGEGHEAVPHNGLPPGESPLPLEEQQRNLEHHVERIRTAAQAGDAVAQYIYGNLLYNGVAGLELKPNTTEAVLWWQKSAAQGHKPAQGALEATSRTRTPQ